MDKALKQRLKALERGTSIKVEENGIQFKATLNVDMCFMLDDLDLELQDCFLSIETSVEGSLQFLSSDAPLGQQMWLVVENDLQEFVKTSVGQQLFTSVKQEFDEVQKQLTEFCDREQIAMYHAISEI